MCQQTAGFPTTSSGIPHLPRGVHRLPVFGPKGEWQLVAVDSKGREVAREVAKVGHRLFAANKRLWAALYRSDPR